MKLHDRLPYLCVQGEIDLQVQAKAEAEIEAKVHKAVVHLKHPYQKQTQKQGIIDTPKMHGHVKINTSVNNIVIVNIRKQQIQNLIVEQNLKAKRT